MDAERKLACFALWGIYLAQVERVVTRAFSRCWMATAVALTALMNQPANAGVGAQPPLPEQGDFTDLYAGVQELYDGNLFRLAPGLTPSDAIDPNASRSDIETTGSVGADIQRVYDRQTVLLDLHLDENRFERNTSLNNTSGYGKLLVNWEVGPYFTGTAGANYSHALTSYGEALYLGRDLVTVQDYLVTGRYQLGPHWSVYGGVDDSRVAHSAPAAQSSDFRTENGDAGVEYAFDATDTVSAEYHYDEGQFNSGEVFTYGSLTFSPNFHDDILLLVGKHSFSDKTQLVAQVGYQKRFYPATSIGSFAGDVWRVTFNWTPTEKTQVAIAAWHELHAYLVAQSNYFVSEGGSITPTWFATEKLSFAALVSYESQKYIPESQSYVVAAGGPLKANITVERANINYSPRDFLQLSLSYIHTIRSSDALSFRYGDDLATFSVLYKTR